MYDKRIKIFVILSTLLLLVCLLRLTQMQLLPSSSVQSDIEELKRQRGQSQELKTVRGKILDRTGKKVLATDEPQFQLCINYKLTCFMDDRIRDARLSSAAGKEDTDAVAIVQKELDIGLADLNQIINKCAQFKGVRPLEIKKEIQRINDIIWNQRTFQAWRGKFPNSEVFQNYDSKIAIPFNEAKADFETKEPNEIKRLLLVNKIDIADMHDPKPLLELKTDDDIFAAQLEFLKVDDIQILPKARRTYPYGTAAAQTIGWVGLVTHSEDDSRLFADDKLSSYLSGEICGREDGVEYVCETILRGRRGELIYDIDSQLISQTMSRFGKDVSLTLDIELQQRIENYLTTYNHELSCGPGMSVVVIEIGTGDILALVSMPVFDLNRARYDYSDLANDPDKPLINRAINKWYPPGSVVKPLILIAGLESGKITPEEIIGCPAQKAPKGWPSCLLYNRYRTGHDGRWENTALNAIRGSCNIYFSRLADRIDPLVLQQWLFKFGYGRNILFPPLSFDESELFRNLRQLQGVISNTIPRETITSFEQVPPLSKSERRWFGIGQGNLRVTPLQVANAMAAIARGGAYKPPRLFMDNTYEFDFNKIDLGISLQTLAVIYDGMSAVVNETGGTAYTTFQPILTSLAEQDIKVYGKTGSTQAPENAWFGGFATDSQNRSIAIAVVVEGGQSGSSDAAPLARDIIQFCIDAGYVGKAETQPNLPNP
ncbi:MAG TPA: penicillin-binding transpeptidase domain-containing protein [Sedimentisphaerales bacterium]|nr:penicillin-binding transpeptidase domain-containing protein [Sedimentisphaerales bacterium]